MNKHIWLVLLLRNNGIEWQTVASSLAAWTITHFCFCFSCRWLLYFGMQRQFVMHHFVTENIKKMCPQSCDLMKCIMFTAASWTCLNVWVILKDMKATPTVPLGWFGRRHWWFYPPLLWGYQSKYWHNGKVNNISEWLWK